MDSHKNPKKPLSKPKTAAEMRVLKKLLNSLQKLCTTPSRKNGFIPAKLSPKINKQQLSKKSPKQRLLDLKKELRRLRKRRQTYFLQNTLDYTWTRSYFCKTTSVHFIRQTKASTKSRLSSIIIEGSNQAPDSSSGAPPI
jgi:hypothetical protein